MQNENNKIHFGVYGIYIKDNNILVIKKGRGPYTGKYDLPGGRVEFGEKVEDTLKREFKEEVGGEIKSADFFMYNQNFLENFHHFGLYFIINECKIEKINDQADGHDSLGAEFVDVDSLNESNCAGIALETIRKYKKSLI